jgi:hypothetical protein
MPLSESDKSWARLWMSLLKRSKRVRIKWARQQAQWGGLLGAVGGLGDGDHDENDS